MSEMSTSQEGRQDGAARDETGRDVAEVMVRLRDDIPGCPVTSAHEITSTTKSDADTTTVSTVPIGSTQHQDFLARLSAALFNGQVMVNMFQRQGQNNTGSLTVPVYVAQQQVIPAEVQRQQTGESITEQLGELGRGVEVVEVEVESTGTSAVIQGQTVNIQELTTHIPGQSTHIQGHATQIQGQTMQMQGQTTQLQGQTTHIQGQTIQIQQAPTHEIGEDARVQVPITHVDPKQTVVLGLPGSHVRVPVVPQRLDERVHVIGKQAVVPGAQESAERVIVEVQDPQLRLQPLQVRMPFVVPGAMDIAIANVLGQELRIPREGPLDRVVICEQSPQSTGSQDSQGHPEREVTKGHQTAATPTDQTTHHCSYCKNAFETDTLLKQHEKSHIREKMYKCVNCNKTSTELKFMKEHEFKYEAYHCEECFNKPKPQNLSVSSNNRKGMNRCQFCGKNFSKPDRLERHERKHLTGNSYQCKDCNMEFTRKDRYEEHGRTHTGELPFKCHICDKSFRIKSTHARHERAHGGDKPHKCDQCEMSFLLPYKLKRHLRTHTGEKPYQCSQCEKRFGRKDFLKQHEKTHMRVDPHIQICE